MATIVATHLRRVPRAREAVSEDAAAEGGSEVLLDPGGEPVAHGGGGGGVGGEGVGGGGGGGGEMGGRWGRTGGRKSRFAGVAMAGDLLSPTPSHDPQSTAI